MTATLAADSESFALQLHALLRDLDAARFRSGREADVRRRLADGRATARALADAAAAHRDFQRLAAPLGEASRVLDHSLPAEDLPRPHAKAAWHRFRKELAAAYAGLSAGLEAWDIHTPSLRPTNYARNVMHVTSGVVAVGLLGWLREPSVLIPITAFFAVLGWSLETGRRFSPAINRFCMWIFGPVAHPHEAWRVNSATWYASALLLLAVLGIYDGAAVGLMALGLGDPSAAIVGRRFGRTRLVNGRSLEGTTAFVVAATLGALPALAWMRPDLAVGALLAVSVAGAVGGAVAELVSRRVDDNFSIPVVGSIVAHGALAALGG